MSISNQSTYVISSYPPVLLIPTIVTLPIVRLSSLDWTHFSSHSPTLIVFAPPQSSVHKFFFLLISLSWSQSSIDRSSTSVSSVTDLYHGNNTHCGTDLYWYIPSVLRYRSTSLLSLRTPILSVRWFLNRIVVLLTFFLSFVKVTVDPHSSSLVFLMYCGVPSHYHFRLQYSMFSWSSNFLPLLPNFRRLFLSSGR